MLPPALASRAAKIKLLCSDVDGVLTTGALHYGPEAGHYKSFNVKDGAGIKWLQGAGIPVALISGLGSPATAKRAADLQIEDCFMGHLEKLPILLQLCAKYGLEPEEVAHLGDDLHDLPLFRRVGLAAAPRDAAIEVQEAAHWVLPIDGGQGLLRAVAEEILKAQGKWDAVLKKYE